MTRSIRDAPPPTQRDLIRQRFVPTVVYAREDDEFHTRLCVYNYFSELFPQVKSGATVAVWLFDTSGNLVAQHDIQIGYRGQVQLDLSTLGVTFEGTAGVSLIPDTPPEFPHKGVGTGYYVLYYDDQGHADYSHEWEAMRFTQAQAPPWLCVIRPLLFPDTQLIVMNGYYGTDPREGTAQWVVRLRDGQGAILHEVRMEPLPPRGSKRFPLSTVFPDLAEVARSHPTLGVEVTGTNIQGPFTFVRVPSGDFNIHHFC